MRRDLDEREWLGWRLRLAGDLIVGCDPGGRILRANRAARSVASHLGIRSPERLLPAEHQHFITSCLASGKPLVRLAVFNEHCFRWTYRRLRRREIVCLLGRCLDDADINASCEAQMLKQALGQFAFGVLVVDTELSIRYANPRARALLESAYAGATRAGRLFDSDALLRGRLEALVREGQGALTLSRDGMQSPLELMVTRLVETPAQAAADGLALVCLIDPDYVPSAYPARLRELYGVTPAEARVADALRRGSRLEKGARDLGVGQATIRSHVKALCRKLGAERKAELLWRLNICIATLIVASEWLSNFKDIL